jgi:DNA invertase Pin-like site-specific DNA recombinase
VARLNTSRRSPIWISQKIRTYGGEGGVHVAEFERELIRERTGEGRKRAMAAGIKFDRKRKLSDYQRAEAIKRRAAGETLASIAKSYGVHVTMISRL